MKKVLSFIVISFITVIAAYADEARSKVEREWITHSYNYGKAGYDCSNIYYDYGTPEFTVNSEDTALPEKLYEACRTGHKNKLSGTDDLPLLMNAEDREN